MLLDGLLGGRQGKEKGFCRGSWCCQVILGADMPSSRGSWEIQGLDLGPSALSLRAYEALGASPPSQQSLSSQHQPPSSQNIPSTKLSQLSLPRQRLQGVACRPFH